MRPHGADVPAKAAKLSTASTARDGWRVKDPQIPKFGTDGPRSVFALAVDKGAYAGDKGKQYRPCRIAVDKLFAGGAGGAGDAGDISANLS